jgi:hypothetical protein
MPIFAGDGSFVWSGIRAFRDRWVSREAGFASVFGVTAFFDVLRERFELVAVLACARRGLVLERP